MVKSMSIVFKNLGHLLLNYLYDIYIFMKYSSVFSSNNEEKLLGRIGYYYHAIEKGLINNPLRYRFGKDKINHLVANINKWIKSGYDLSDSQFIASCSVLLKYYNLHKSVKIHINDIISDETLDLIEKYGCDEVGGTFTLNATDYFKEQFAPFESFSNSRHSIRHFRSEKIDVSKIENSVFIARNAPSVCNRQSVEVYLINNKEITQDILKIQSGMNATSENVQQIIIITSEIGAFISPVERNQMFVDGGIFLQNLLYALHFNGIAACALNWSKPFFYEFNIRKHLKISHQKRIISAIAIGYPKDNLKVPFSSRKNVDEILRVIN